MKMLECTEFRVIEEKTPFGTSLVIKCNEENEAFIDDDEIAKLCEFLQKFLDTKPQESNSK